MKIKQTYLLHSHLLEITSGKKKKAQNGKYKKLLSGLNSVSCARSYVCSWGCSCGCQVWWCWGREYVFAAFIIAITDKERDVFISYTLSQACTRTYVSIICRRSFLAGNITKWKWNYKKANWGLAEQCSMHECPSKVVLMVLFPSAGVIVGVDENTAYSWPACNLCGSDNLELSAERPYVLSVYQISFMFVILANF